MKKIKLKSAGVLILSTILQSNEYYFSNTTWW